MTKAKSIANERVQQWEDLLLKLLTSPDNKPIKVKINLHPSNIRRGLTTALSNYNDMQAVMEQPEITHVVGVSVLSEVMNDCGTMYTVAVSLVDRPLTSKAMFFEIIEDEAIDEPNNNSPSMEDI